MTHPENQQQSPNAPSEASRVAAFAEAIMGGAERAALLTVRNPGEVANAYRDARAVVAVADAEQADLRAEVAQLRRQWHQECDNFERECNRADAAERARDAALAEVTELRMRIATCSGSCRALAVPVTGDTEDASPAAEGEKRPWYPWDDRKYLVELLRAVESYDSANQSDLPLGLLDSIRAVVAGAASPTEQATEGGA